VILQWQKKVASAIAILKNNP